MTTIEALGLTGQYLLTPAQKDLDEVIEAAVVDNSWFVRDDIRKALKQIANQYLNVEKLEEFQSKYQHRLNTPEGNRKMVALILAGNIPLVGFHDILCVLLSGHRCLIKLSDKDKVLIPFVLNKLCFFEPGLTGCFQYTERIKGFDAIIATGSNHSGDYFDKYFYDFPRLIRRNRNAVAILTGRETPEQLLALGEDVFSYFGLGCRNVSKLYVPKDYDFTPVLEIWQDYRDLANHHKYRNNLDYFFASAIINNQNYKRNDAIILLENRSISSRIGTLHYETYDDIQNLRDHLLLEKSSIQCVVTMATDIDLPVISFGQTQAPGLSDFADDVDTMQFLLDL